MNDEAYEVRKEVPAVEVYRRIRREAGMSDKSEAAARVGLANGLFSVVVYFGDEPIGLGRVIGDGGCFFQIVDIAVVPAHQKKGVGHLIMSALMEWLHANAPATAYVSLMAHHGTPDFYARYGFTAAEKPDAAGMYLRIKKPATD
jgi:GNAT superfamily N-acetyltransferase